MRKLREVLSLRYELKLGYLPDRAKLRDRGEHGSPVPNADRGSGVTWPLPEDWDEARVEVALFPHPESVVEKPAARGYRTLLPFTRNLKRTSL
jgi:hypothetical protein